MKFDVVESVKSLLGIEEGSNVELVFDNIGSVAHSGENTMESIQNIANTEMGISTLGRHLIDFFNLTSLIKEEQPI